MAEGNSSKQEILGILRNTRNTQRKYFKNLRAHFIGHSRLVGVYFMTFIDISCRLAVKPTCTNRICNISRFWGPTSGFVKLSWSHLIGHPRLVGGLFYDFY